MADTTRRRRNLATRTRQYIKLVCKHFRRITSQGRFGVFANATTMMASAVVVAAAGAGCAHAARVPAVAEPSIGVVGTDGCWSHGVRAEICCDVARGPRGAEACWDGVHNFDRCCTELRRHGLLSLPPPSGSSSASSPEWRRGRRLVFIDVGANCGGAYKLFLRRGFIAGDDWEVYLWEANLDLVDGYLTDLAIHDRRVTVIPRAAWTTTRKMAFFLARGEDNAKDSRHITAQQCLQGISQSSSLFSGTGAAGADDLPRNRSRFVPGHRVEVEAVDFAMWLRSLRLSHDDTVVVKMDIEGAEVPLLRSLLDAEDDVVCLIDNWFVEWHSWMLAKGPSAVRSPITAMSAAAAGAAVAAVQAFEAKFPQELAGRCEQCRPVEGGGVPCFKLWF
eukprot:TRINITY_DN30693_c0_g1_i1.p1 TRINITY_DN30693_c0_g1~~TRINITY_DN30693_c0_g1_i1.p1  ORF type:complete len:391 (-),score=65.77 TRINITY_DN30693_c0_g1_i1:17-1189(-)